MPDNEITIFAVMGGGLFILVVVIVVLKFQNQKIRTFLRNTAGEHHGSSEKSAPRRGVSGKFVSVNKLQDGDVLGDDVRDPAGKVVLLEKGTQLSERNIDKLKNWEIKSVLLK